MKNIIYTLLLSFSLSSYALASCYDERATAKVNFVSCELQAKQGDAWAQNYLGAMYEKGQVVLQNHKEAVKWFRKSAEQGLALAQDNLGAMHSNGKGVPQNHKKALKWYRMAAEQGFANAQFNLGMMYENGHSVTQDYKEAVKWYSLAAEQGHVSAQFNLGVMRHLVQDTPQNHKKALKWYRMAAEQGFAPAQSNLGIMYFYGQGVPRDHKEAFKWIKKAAEQGNSQAEQILKPKYETYNWDIGTRRSTTQHRNNYLAYDLVLESSVGFSKGGGKNIYFGIIKGKDGSCKPEDYKSKGYLDSVWEFNDQAVSMLMFCKKYSNSETYYISASPASVEGRKFVVNAFKKASDSVLIKGNGYKFPISAKGFSKVWNKISRKVL